jgi:hypothetical protein
MRLCILTLYLYLTFNSHRNLIELLVSYTLYSIFFSVNIRKRVVGLVHVYKSVISGQPEDIVNSINCIIRVHICGLETHYCITTLRDSLDALLQVPLRIHQRATQIHMQMTCQKVMIARFNESL